MGDMTNSYYFHFQFHLQSFYDSTSLFFVRPTHVIFPAPCLFSSFGLDFRSKDPNIIKVVKFADSHHTHFQTKPYQNGGPCHPIIDQATGLPGSFNDI
jgi:hypothetical protein